MRFADVQCLAGGLITGMTQAGMTIVRKAEADKTPLTCPKCGAGPFKGQHGLGIHTARTACGT